MLLARALAVQAQVLLMDEPLANLDPPHQADWLLLVRALVAQGTTVVSVLHELSMALHADDVVVMAGGRVQHHGAAAMPATHRALERVFDQRIAIHAVAGQWVALPQLHGAPPDFCDAGLAVRTVLESRCRSKPHPRPSPTRSPKASAAAWSSSTPATARARARPPSAWRCARTGAARP